MLSGLEMFTAIFPAKNKARQVRSLSPLKPDGVTCNLPQHLFPQNRAKNNDASVNLDKVLAIREMMAEQYEEMFPGKVCILYHSVSVRV